jgi:hypothetical protein
VAKSGIRKSDTSEGKMKYPSREPLVIPEYYAACHFPETVTDVVDTNNPIQGMLSHVAMMSSRKKAQRLSVMRQIPSLRTIVSNKKLGNPGNREFMERSNPKRNRESSQFQSV